ncbi:hypothetical protein TNCV_3508501 [Trichonephila clavipes]|nr:hypothetical protein TNCV_3508501 [Trichonephila clavipes]
MVSWIVHPCWYCDERILRRHRFRLQSLLNRILLETYKSERLFKYFSFVMDPIDAFPEHLSTTVMPVTLPDIPMHWNMLLDRAKSELASSTKSPPPNGCFFCFVKTIGIKKDVVRQFQTGRHGGKACQ